MLKVHLSIVEEGIEYLVEEDDWREDEVQQSQQTNTKPQSRCSAMCHNIVCNTL